MARNSRALLRAVTAALTHGHVGRPGDRRLVHSTPDTPVLEDRWARRIMELGDGRSVMEIIETIYGEELRAGAWMADIGLWSHLCARSVAKVIHELEDRGYILITHPGPN